MTLNYQLVFPPSCFLLSTELRQLLMVVRLLTESVEQIILNLFYFLKPLDKQTGNQLLTELAYQRMMRALELFVALPKTNKATILGEEYL
ncbi:hypothetical protein SDC9_185375 [bioreactor metagenome]|uniref:Uncharacterized protein n=1 Tax=bioreactor metagenome TaxID=1076179 RepID=A0A645HP11_9ZZZZ